MTGSDSGSPPRDSAVPSVLPPITACEPMQARPMLCSCEDGGPSTYAWNGLRCLQVSPCTCEGPDCSRTFTTLDACRTITRDCDSRLCLRTGGHWYAELQFCGHFDCSGVPPPVLCEVPRPSCNCGHGSRFVAGEGCRRVEESCELAGPQVHCEATGGTWGCLPGDTAPCDPDCQCAADRTFLDGYGCVPTWQLTCDGTFCPIDDGQPCDPAAPACTDRGACCRTSLRGDYTCGRAQCITGTPCTGLD